MIFRIIIVPQNNFLHIRRKFVLQFPVPQRHLTRIPAITFALSFMRKMRCNTKAKLNALTIQSRPVMLKMVLGVSEQMVSQRRSTTFSKVAKTSFRKPRFRISFQICSIGFISGVYGGIWKSTIFSGTSSVPDLCHTLPVHTLAKKAVTGKGTSLAQ